MRLTLNEKRLVTADQIIYDSANDSLYADGKHVGGADAFTRRAMMARADESWHDSDDEALFEALVTEWRTR